MFKQPVFIITMIALLLSCAIINHSDAQIPSKSGVRPQVLSLPGGPGAIEGFGESFEPQLNMGTGSYVIPIKLPPGRASFTPELNLTYNSGNGNGLIGMGWHLPLMSIKRQTDKGLPHYTSQDSFIADNGRELVCIQSSESKILFRLKNESHFFKYEYFPADDYWICTDRSGKKYYLSETLQHPGIQKTYAWYVSRIVDTNGNQIIYHYSQYHNQIYCHYIAYGPVEKGFPDECHAVFFHYENRHDPIADYRPTFRMLTDRRLNKIVIKTRNKLVRSYTLTYATDRLMSLLFSILVSGHDNTVLPEIKFHYTREYPDASNTLMQINGLDGAFILRSQENPTDYPGACEIIDFNGDALPDLYQSRNQSSDPLEYEIFYENLGNGSFIRRPLTQSQSLNLNIQSQNSFVMDIDGDGLSDVVSQKGQNPEDFVYKRNIGGQWAILDIAFTFPHLQHAEDVFVHPNIRSFDINADKKIDTIRSYWSKDPQTNGILFEAFLNNGDGSFEHIPRTTTGIIKGLSDDFSQSEGRLVIADMNGDRMQDLVLLRDCTNNNLLYWPSMGWGKFDDSSFGYEIQLTDGPDFMGDLSQIKKLHLEDLNSDGLADLYLVTGSQILYWLNQGRTMGKRSEINMNQLFDPSCATFRLIDIDGDRLKEVLFYVSQQPSPDYISTGFWYLRLFSNRQGSAGSITPNLLYQIDNGMGGTIHITWQSHIFDMISDRQSDNKWSYHVPFPVSVVKEIEENDGTNTFKRIFNYYNGYYDGTEKEFRGFESVSQVEIGDHTVPDLITSYSFHTGLSFEALKGKQRWCKKMNSQGEIFSQKKTVWKTRHLQSSESGKSHVVFPYQSSQSIHLIEKNSGSPVTLTTEYEYDNFGNMTRQTELGRDDNNFSDERITDQTYSSGYDSGKKLWILDKIIDRKITDITGKLEAHTRYYYDKQTQTGNISKGNLTQIEQWISDKNYIVTQKNDIDTYGNISASYDPLYPIKPGHYREFIYDTHFHIYPENEIIHTGNPSLPVLQLSATYDYGTGGITSFTDFNQHTTYYHYDGLGRLMSIQKPLDDGHTIEYEYVLGHLIDDRIFNWLETRKKDNSPDGFLISRQFYDGMGKKLMMRSEGETSEQTIVTDAVVYNSRKKIVKKYLPFFDLSGLDYQNIPENTPYIQYFYDALNRKIRTNQPQGPDGIDYSTVTYEPLARIIRDEEQTKAGSKHSGCFKKFIYDGLLDDSGQRRLREIHESVKLSDNGDFIHEPAVWVTSYDYDLLNNLEQHTDAQENQKIWKFDGLSRKIFENDPDRGIMTYEYDDAGNLLQTLDANNKNIYYEYDGINRLTRIYFENKNHPADIEYHYDLAEKPLNKGHLLNSQKLITIQKMILSEYGSDSSYDLNADGQIDSADTVIAGRQLNVMAENTHGFLAWVKDQSGEQHFSYDAHGRTSWIVKRIRNQKLDNYFTAMTYDAMDRLSQLTYPDGSLIHYTYNSRGLLASIPNVIDQINYDPFEKPSKIELVCNVDISTVNDFRGRLGQMKAVRNHDNQILWDSFYAYDSVSNMTEITDQRTKESLNCIAKESNSSENTNFSCTQSFTYDALYRLIHASSPTVYGDIHYQYDRIGNLTQKTAALTKAHPLMNLGMFTSGGKTGTWNRIGRQTGDEAGPHAITNAGEMFFQYDQNGNMTNHNGIDFEWDVNNQLIRIKDQLKTTNYIYDYAGNRTIKHSMPSNQKVLYINQYAEIRKGQLIKYVIFDHKRIASSQKILQPGQKLLPSTFYIHNHLGSTAISLSKEATVTAQMAYYPYGQIREKTDQTIFYGFTGREKDLESDLMYFKHRYYAPHLAGFVSVDPMFQFFSEPEKQHYLLADPQHLNPYAYTNHSPVIYFDPSGLLKVWFGVETYLSTGKLTLFELGGQSLYDTEKGESSIQGKTTVTGTQAQVDFASNEGKIGTQTISLEDPLGFSNFSVEVSGLGNTKSQQVNVTVKGSLGSVRFKGGSTFNLDVYKAYQSNNDLKSLLTKTEFTFEVGLGKKLNLKGVKAGVDFSIGAQGTLNEFKDFANQLNNNVSDLLMIDGKEVFEVFSAY